MVSTLSISAPPSEVDHEPGQRTTAHQMLQNIQRSYYKNEAAFTDIAIVISPQMVILTVCEL